MWRTASPGMKSMVGSGAAVPPARDRWDSQSGVKGQMVWPHPRRCQHILNSPQFTRNQYQALQFRRYYELKKKNMNVFQRKCLLRDDDFEYA